MAPMVSRRINYPTRMYARKGKQTNNWPQSCSSFYVIKLVIILIDFDYNIIVICRKTLPEWSEHVRFCPESGLEGPLNDGYSWRKYGQKLILGANFPRWEPSYCTNSCLLFITQTLILNFLGSWVRHTIAFTVTLFWQKQSTVWLIE